MTRVWWNPLTWFSRVSEATHEEIYGTPVNLWELFAWRGRWLLPVFGPEQKKEKNQTIRTIQQLDMARNQSRVLVETNPNAAGLVKNLIDYNVGKGSSTEIHGAEEGEEPPRRLAVRVKKFIKVLKKANRWAALEKEMKWRLLVDGEFFLRFFPQADGVTQLRFVEPGAIRPPAGQDGEGEWSYGIWTPDGDAQTPQAYCVHNFSSQSQEIVEAQFIIHGKANCTSSQKRGVPYFYACEDELVGSAKLRHATREGEKARAAIAYFRVHDTADETAVRAFQQSNITETINRPTQTGSNETIYAQKIEPGTVEDIPKGLKPEPPPVSGNTEGSSRAVQNALEAVAARFNVPYWMVSGDPNATNFASSLTAESPFTKSLEGSQSELAEYTDEAQSKCLEIASEQGLMPDDVLEQIDLLVSFPSCVVRNRKEETDRRKILHDNGVMSKTTWATEEGYDPAKQRQQRIEEQQQEMANPPALPAPSQNGKAPSGTANGRYSQLINRPEN